MSIWYKDQNGYTKDQSGGGSFLIQGPGVEGANTNIGIYGPPSAGPASYRWVRGANGKRSVAVTAPAAGGGPFAAGAAPHITVTVTGLTTAADAASSAIVVNTTAVNATSRISADIISYAGTYVTNGVPIVALGAIVAGTSFAFQIVNVGTQPLSGNITIAFTIEN